MKKYRLFYGDAWGEVDVFIDKNFTLYYQDEATIPFDPESNTLHRCTHLDGEQAVLLKLHFPDITLYEV